tara:strand:- start:4473 stop:5822 length:1350 start_codon:yes stop_codon:yes gene_type:complete
MLKKITITAFILFFSHVALATTQVTDIRVSHQLLQTRIVFSLSHSVQYNVFPLYSPDRIVVDMADAKLTAKVSEVDLSKTLIDDIRAGHGKKGDLRLVLDLKDATTHKAFILKNPYRLVVDLTAKVSFKTKTKLKSKPIVGPTVSAVGYQKPKPVLTVQKPKNLRDLIVVIDPGHGGKDPGASGPRGTHEKNVVLSIGDYIKQDLRQYPGIKVYMTRDSDYYVTLRGRLNIARRRQADIFVAVHADSFKNSRARGASVYALSQRGATSESARWLAQRENESEMLGGAELSNKSYLLRSVLIDMSQTATTNNSLQMGRNVLGNLGEFAPLHSKKVEQAAFVVLKSPDIPSILVENGFISNPYEEDNLRTASYRQRLAAGITKGIISYFKQKMPAGTIFSAHYSAQSYIVQHGDSLSGIASKFNVTTSSLKSLNGLTSNAIHVGRVLRIPR